MQKIRTISLSLFLVFVVAASAFGQTFRGTVAGTVVDPQGAVVSNASVQLLNPATGFTQNAKSSSAGEFLFPELPVGTYQLMVSLPGFAGKKIDGIDVAVTKVVTLKVELTVGSENTVVDVTANAIQTDTTSSALVAVIDSKSVQEMPMNGRNFTQMVKYAPGVGALANSVNGSRTSSINFQVDGADNVDAWLGAVASNQGGIASVAGGLIPIEAIDQFSMQSGGEADQGRNAGANSNMVLKSGTNNIHGDVFYFDRNEFFAAINPVAPVGSRKQLIRNHQGGFTLGGPIWKDHTFLFLAGEIQVAKASTSLNDTVLSDSWIAAATSFMANPAFSNGGATLRPNQLSSNLYGLLYPTSSKGGAATTNNYFANGTANYNSYNGIIKLDHRFSDKQSISIRYLGTTGKQTAPTASDYADYFQTAPMHIHNASVVHTYIFNSHLLNQVTLGMNYFLQTFNDANQGFYPQQNAGLNLGISAGIVAAGAPSIIFSNTTFDQVGATQPSGRTDVAGHVTDSMHWTIGRHALKIGGEYRRANINQLYFSSARGTFTFDGSRGPWSTGTAGSAVPTAAATAACTALGFTTTTSSCVSLMYVADFLNGQPTNSGGSGARLLQGNAQRVWLLNSEDLWLQDSFQATKKLNINFGVRYSVPGVVHSEKNDTYSFVPGTTPGFQLGLYNNYYKAVAPRLGFAYSPFENNTTVIRGSWGIFYDVPPMSSMVSGTTTNGGANYSQNNPAGPDAAVIFNASNVTWAVGVNPFTGAVPPQLGAFGVDPNIAMPYAEVFSFGLEQQLSRSTLFTVGYVGSEGRRLLTLRDLNQPIASGNTTTNPRPYLQTSFPNQTLGAGKTLLGINQLNSKASSNYNSLQATIKQAAWHGVQTTLNYTWGKSLDDGSSSTTPMNSYNLHQDYGPSTFDARHTVTGFAYYTVPQLFHALPRLTKGFQVNGLYTISTGTPISPTVSGDISRTTELKDRPNVVPGTNPYVGGTAIFTNNASGRTYRYLGSNAVGTASTGALFATPAAGTYGNMQRDSYYGPMFRTVDVSLFKHTPITERVMSELRVEIFNVFNINNFANPNVSISSGQFGVISNTRNAAGAPGLGYGEPFNIQFALKVSF
jgi:hypothetical protein